MRVGKDFGGANESAPPVGGAVEVAPKFLPGAKTFAVPAAGAAGGGLTMEKAARVEKIRRDYEEVRIKLSADYRAAGEKFPGGLNAFLRQLALLEREMHADFAAVLTPRELEDYELRESPTGQALQRRLVEVAVDDEQRREVFRRQREFDDRFALVFDVTPAALLERCQVQLIMREKIRATLGDEGYAAWLRAEDPSYAAMRELALHEGRPAAAVGALWQIKDEWTLQKLEIGAQAGLTTEQRAAMLTALGEQTRSRVTALIGPHAMVPGSAALGWLPVVK
jgi:hypothetical protein